MRLLWLLFYLSMALSGKTFHAERSLWEKGRCLDETARRTVALRRAVRYILTWRSCAELATMNTAGRRSFDEEVGDMATLSHSC